MILGLTFPETAVIGLLFAAIQFGAMIYLASLGEMVAERAGVLNLGVEGMMAMGAVGGFVFAFETGNPWLGLLAAAVIGGSVGMMHGLFAVGLGANQGVSGWRSRFSGSVSPTSGAPITRASVPRSSLLTLTGVRSVTFPGSVGSCSNSLRWHIWPSCWVASHGSC